MTDHLNQFEISGDQHRTTEIIHSIRTAGGTVLIRTEQDTEMTETGDVNTREIVHSQMIDGQHIHSASQVKGECRICGRILTELTFRHCFQDATTLCPACAAFDEQDQRWLCKSCYRSIRWGRFWDAVGRLMISPFVQRSN